MIEKYKKYWEQINCKRCKFASYGENPKCKITNEEKEELMKSTSCSLEMKLCRKNK